MTSIIRPISICAHLAEDPDEYHVWFTGRDRELFWVCPKCVKGFPVVPTDLLEASDELVKQCQSEAFWDGIVGSPEIKHRESSMRFEHEVFELKGQQPAVWVDVQPNVQSDGNWFVLLPTGEFANWLPNSNEIATLFRLTELSFEIDAETGFCVSKQQDYLAVYQTSGQLACVFDMESGSVVFEIDRGEYRPENSHFPIAFFDFNGITQIVAATAWNKLDIFDAKTGQILTDRTLPEPNQGEARPDRYLDYFHCQLSVSPDSNWIVDNGWVWAPWGSVRCWDLQFWMRSNPWESEDGTSAKTLADRAYYWDGPLCWIDESTVAIWGWGLDDEWLLPAIQFVDAQSGELTGWIPGPDTRRPRAGPPKKLAPSLFFDRYLFAVHHETGTTAWDIVTGERLSHEPSLMPIHYHPASKQFLALHPNGVQLSRWSCD